MKNLGFLLPGTLLLLMPWASSSAQNITSKEMRGMTATDFQRHIDEEGAQPFVRRILTDVDPHSPEEPNYDIVLEHVAEGSPAWLKVAARIAPFTDSTFSQGLRIAIADALVANPSAVLTLVGTEEHFDQACGYPFVHQTDTYMLRHQRDALGALNRVRQPGLSARKESCRKQLMDVPTTQAQQGQPSGPTRE